MIRKTLLTITAAFAMLALGSVARADTVVFGPGQFGSTATVTDYSLNAAKTTFQFTVNNTSSTGSITAIGFDLAARTDGQSRGTFTLTTPSDSDFSAISNINTTAGANTNSTVFDFALLTGKTFGGGKVADGVLHNTSMTFIITGDFSGLTAQEIAQNLFLRFQGIGRRDESEVLGPGNPTPNNPVPEPMTMLLFGTGLAGIAARARRNRNKKA